MSRSEDSKERDLGLLFRRQTASRMDLFEGLRCKSRRAGAQVQPCLRAKAAGQLERLHVHPQKELPAPGSGAIWVALEAVLSSKGSGYARALRIT